MFIAVDGIDGAGKTTLVRQLAEFLAPMKPLVTKEPTSDSEWGRALRDAALRERLPRDIELEYFHKDRLHHLATEIIPALNEGRPVICDRYVDSTLAFQANDPSSAEAMYQSFLPAIRVPDVTFILDCPVDVGLSRILGRRNGFTAFETSDILERARQIYQSRRGPNYSHIDATQSPDNTFEKAKRELLVRFPSLGDRPAVLWRDLSSPLAPVCRTA